VIKITITTDEPVINVGAAECCLQCFDEEDAVYYSEIDSEIGEG
jgi:hypothetical protein